MSLFDPVWTLFRGNRARGAASTVAGPAGDVTTPPIITEVRHDLVVGAYDEAVRRAYLGALADAKRAYNLQFPAGWTHPEILAHGFPASSGDLAVSFRRLYDLYRPIRYGPPRTHRTKEPVVELLQDIYGRVPMWSLYVEAPRSAAADGQAGADEYEETYEDEAS